jgi:hypothetical protein
MLSLAEFLSIYYLMLTGLLLTISLADLLSIYYLVLTESTIILVFTVYKLTISPFINSDTSTVCKLTVLAII